MIRYIPIVAPLILVACGSGTGGTSAVQKLLQADTYYGKALAAAESYEDLPRCASGVSDTCSIPSAVEELRERDLKAHNALNTAKVAVGDGKISNADENIIDEARDEVFDYLELLAKFGIKVELD